MVMRTEVGELWVARSVCLAARNFHEEYVICCALFLHLSLREFMMMFAAAGKSQPNETDNNLASGRPARK